MKLTANRITGILRKNGFKLTPQRHTILGVIADSHDHLSPEEIYEQANERMPSIGLVTVYRTLEILNSLQLVCRVHTGDGRRNYMMRRPDGHHHHIVCSGCGRVVDFSGCDLKTMEQKLSGETGFNITSHLLEFYGLCPDCAHCQSA